MARFPTFRAALALGLSATLSVASHDPVNDFCRRFGQQTTVVGRQLYIDGGLVNWNPLPSNPDNDTNTWLLNQALDVDNGQGFPQLYANLSKNGSIPTVSGGVLWSDSTNMLFYQWAGEYQTNPQGPTFYIYDVLLNQWNKSDADLSGLSRVAYGAGTTVEERGEGYYFGGWLNDQTVPGWDGPPIATSNLIRYDMGSNTFTNNTGPDGPGRAEGALVFLPASDKGLLVYFGGVQDPYKNGTTVGANMSEILVYDLASEKWYTQNATGDVPDMRGKFCAGATWPEDRSSYNIYLYGGQGHEKGDVAFDDVYILTLPSFQWIKWYPTTPGPGRPHYDLTCNVVDGSQMLIIGGTFPLDDDCDSPNVYGTHNLNMGQNGPQNSTWDLFYPNITKYSVPPAIVSAVGGSASGGATNRTPTDDWNNRDLAVYFTRYPSFDARTATRPVPGATGAPDSKSGGSSNGGAIAGGVVGGVVGLGLIIGIVWFCLRRRKQQGGAKKIGVKRSKTIRAELDATAAPVEAGGTPLYHRPSKPGSSRSYDGAGSPEPTYSTTTSTLPPYTTPVSPYGQQPQGMYMSPAQQQQQQQQQYYNNGYQQLHSQQYQQQPQQPQYQQYDPSQDIMRQQHYPPPQAGAVSPPGQSSPDQHGSPVSYEAPRSPPTSQNTPAHFYPQPLHPNRGSEGKRSPQPAHGRFIEEDE
ncbi:MAG: hypothetical protein M1820_004828 [Bogoriella megaspora]|nr:MAG: hypothetical protein M1820_004828 [Bogoriella megaspora]